MTTVVQTKEEDLFQTVIEKNIFI